jgi:hypothetical protein
MQTRPPLPGIEASTSGIKVLKEGLRLFPSLVNTILATQNLPLPGPGDALLGKERWFPLDTWLSVLDMVYTQVGPNALHKLGTEIMANPKFPPWIRDIDSALESIDIAYHRSHRKNGVVMYDDTSSQMLEGIGHYRARRVAAEQKIEVTCDTPYRCIVDLGIVTGTARKFEARVRVTHGTGKCRDDGGTSCTYVVTW